jgi:diacylglycerol kinase (ATP)
MKWTIIRNPNAASGKCQKIWPDVRKVLLDNVVDFEDLRTDYPGHATELARESIAKGSRFIIAMGGDGTVNEVANGILGQSFCNPLEIVFTQIPVGTGNDWSRTMNIPKNYLDLSLMLKSGSERIQDVGLFSYKDDKGHEKQRYFVNMAGMGFDASVGEVANRKKAAGKSGFGGYISALLGTLFSYKVKPMSLKIDGEQKGDYQLFSLSAGICIFSGAGMKQCPQAIYNDGLIDITLIEKISKFKVIRNVPALFSGKFVKNKEVHQFRGKYIEIANDSETLLEVDGEVIGKGSCQIMILPLALRVLGAG